MVSQFYRWAVYNFFIISTYEMLDDNLQIRLGLSYPVTQKLWKISEIT